MGGTWTVHGVAGPSLPLPVSDSLVDGFNWHFSNRAIQPPSPTVFVKSYRADVFTIRCCSFLFLNLFRAEKEEYDLLACLEPWYLVKNRYSLDFC